jgi:hypothetical protein
MISQRRKRLTFAPAASDVHFGDCVKRPSALALERRLRCDPSHAGVMPYGRAESWLPRFLPRLTHGATFASPGFACPLL